MARKKSRSRKTSLLFTVVSVLFLAISSAVIGGYFDPDWPVVGPLLQVLHERHAAETPNERGAGHGPQVLATGTGRAADGHSSSTQTQSSSSGRPGQLASNQRPKDKLLIASFNIQVFGKSKLSKPWVVDVLAQVVRQFDLVAIQEIRAKDDDILPRFVAAINSDGSRYDFLIGPRLGRSVSTEQYAFVYDTTRVEYDSSSIGTMSDPADMLHREPFLARFRARTSPPDQAFTFWLVNIHTDPDEVDQEVSALADVFQVMQSARADEDDVILLGDLNANESQFGRLGQIRGISWAVSGVTTNTRQTKAYDNLLFQAESTSEYTGRWGVFDLEHKFGLSRGQALKVSDHLPVWAEFEVREAAPRRTVAARDGGVWR